MRDNLRMLDRLLRRSYKRLGKRYALVFFLSQVPAAAVIAFVVVAILAAYYDPGLGDILLLSAVTAVFTAAGVAFTIVRQYRTLAPMVSWRGAEATRGETIEAWDAATNYPVRSFRRNILLANAIVVVPSATAMVVVLKLPVGAYPVVAAAGAIPMT